MKYIPLTVIFYLYASIVLGQIPENVKIIYNVSENIQQGNYEIYSMNADGSEKRNLSNSPGVDWAYYSHDDKIFFISDRDTTRRSFFLYEMDANGKNVRRITDFLVQDTWIGGRKDGTELIVKPPPSVDDSSFYIINLQGEILSKITPRLPYFSDPYFSPDGKQVVFRGSEAPYQPDSGYKDELYIINEDGTGLRQLTRYPENQQPMQWWNYHAGPPKWEPNSNMIYYNSSRNNSSSLFGISPDGEKSFQLTSDKTYEGWHSWTDDGEWLVFGRSTVEGGGVNYDIYLAKRGSSQPTRLTDSPLQEQAPIFVDLE